MKKVQTQQKKIALGKRTVLKLTNTHLMKMEGGTFPIGDEGQPTAKPDSVCAGVSKTPTKCNTCNCASQGTKAC